MSGLDGGIGDDLQEPQLLGYCGRRGWESILYRDRRQSGAKQNRPALTPILRVAKIIASPQVRKGIRGMKKPNKNKGKSYLDIMKEAGEKYGVKVTDTSERARAIGLLLE